MYYGVLSFNAPYPGYKPSLKIKIESLNCGMLDWSIVSNLDWLSFAPSEGIGDAEITVTADTSGFTKGLRKNKLEFYQ